MSSPFFQRFRPRQKPGILQRPVAGSKFQVEEGADISETSPNLQLQPETSVLERAKP
jgi:hypothetical protein